MIDERFDRLEQKLDKIHDKLDNHLERLSKAETRLDFVAGHLKISTAIFLSVVGTLLLGYWDKIIAIVFNFTQL